MSSSRDYNFEFYTIKKYKLNTEVDYELPGNKFSPQMSVE